MFRRTRKIARKVTISFVMYVCPSVRMEQLGSHQLEINEICHLNRFRTSVEKGVGSFMTITRSVLLWVINTSVKNCRGIQNTHFLFNNFSRKSFRLWDIVEKYGRFRQVTDDILICRMRIAWWISKATHTHTHTLRIANIFLFHNNSYGNAPQCYIYTYIDWLVECSNWPCIQ